MTIHENHKIQESCTIVSNVNYPNKNKINLGPRKKIQKFNNGHFLRYTGKSGRKRKILCHYNKTLSLPSEVYETLRFPQHVSSSVL